MDSGETAQAAPKGKRRTLRQKNRILDETLESDSTDEAKSFRYKDRAHEHYLFVRSDCRQNGFRGYTLKPFCCNISNYENHLSIK